MFSVQNLELAGSLISFLLSFWSLKTTFALSSVTEIWLSGYDTCTKKDWIQTALLLMTLLRRQWLEVIIIRVQKQSSNFEVNGYITTLKFLSQQVFLLIELLPRTLF